MSDQDFIDSVNKELDAESFIRKLGFRVDKVVHIGGIIKAPCMIHCDERFATLLVFPGKNTCNCLKADCPAHGERTLVELYGLHTNKSGVEAALAAAELAGIEVPTHMHAGLLEARVAAAKSGLSPETLVNARQTLEEAEAAGLDNPDVSLLSAGIAALEGNAEGAAMQAAMAAEVLRQSGRLDEAEAALREHADPVQSNNDMIITQWIELLLTRSREQEACELLVNRCERLEKEDAAAASAELLDFFGDLVARDPRLRLHFAKALEAEGDPGKAKAQYQRAAAMKEAEGTLRIEALEAFVRLEPDAADLREELVAVLLQLDRRSEATVHLSTLGSQALKAGALLQARRCYERIVQLDNNSITGREGLAECFRLEKNPAREIEERLSIARIYKEIEFEDQADEQFKLALDRAREGMASSPGDIELILLRRRALLESGAVETPADAARDLHELLEESDALDRVTDILEAQLNSNPTDVTATLLLSSLQEAGEAHEAAIETLARCVEEQDGADPELLGQVADALLRLDPDHSAALAARGRLAAARGDTEEALNALSKAAHAAMETRRYRAAAHLWADVLAIDSTQEEALRLRVESLARGDCADELPGAVRLLLEPEQADMDERERAVVTLCESLVEEDNPAAARALAVAALEARPESLPLLRARWRALPPEDNTQAIEETLQFARQLIEENEPGEAEGALRPLLKHDSPAHTALVRTLALALEKQEKNREAAALLHDLGSRYEKGAQPDEALVLYGDAARLDPENAPAHAGLAALLEERGETERASAAWLVAARLIANSDEPIEAKQLYDRAFELDRANEALAVEYTDYLIKVGARDAACQRAMEIARLAYDGGNAEKGREFCQRSIRAFPLSISNRLLAVRLLIERDTELGVEEAVSAASAFLEKPEPAAARQFVEIGLDASPDHPELLRLAVRVALAEERPNEAATALQRLALLAVDVEDWPTAERSWRDLLEIAPNQEQAREGLATALEKQGGEKAREAVDLLIELAELKEQEGNTEKRAEYQERALALDDSLDDLRRELARTLLDLERFEEARKHFLVLAEAAERDEQHALAVDYYEKILESDPENVELLQKQADLTRASGDTEKFSAYALRLAAAYNKRNRVADAISVCRTIVEADPESQDARVLLASYLARQGDSAGAASALFDAAERYTALGDIHNARDVLSRAERFELEHPGLQKRFGELYLLTGAETEGLSHLQIALRLYQHADEVEEALKVTQMLLTHLGRDQELMRMRCDLLRESGDMKAAASELFALAELQRTQPAYQIATLEEVLKLDPIHREARTLLIGTHRDLGDYPAAVRELVALAKLSLPAAPEEALSPLEEALELEDDFDVELHETMFETCSALGEEKKALEQAVLLIGHLTATGDVESARRVLFDARTEANREAPQLRKLAARLAFKEGRKQEAATELKALAAHFRAEGNIDEETEALEGALEVDPSDEELSTQLADALLRCEDAPLAVKRAEATLRILLGSGEIEFAHKFSDRLAGEPKLEEGIRGRFAALYEEFKIPELAAQHHVALAKLNLERGEVNVATAMVKQALRLRPRDVQARLLMADILELRGEKDAAFDTLRELTVTLMDHSGYGEAIEALRRMLVLRPEDMERREILSTQLERLGRRDEAATELEELARLYQNKGRIEDAIRTRKRLVDIHPEDAKGRLALIELFALSGSSHDLMPALCDLADLYERLGQHDAAIGALEKAAAAAPEEYTLRERLVQALLGEKRTEEALTHTQSLVEALVDRRKYRAAAAALDRVRDIGEGTGDFHLAEAQIHAAQNQRGKAMEGLNKALDLYRTENARDRMLDVMREILVIDPQNADRHEALIALLVEEGRENEALDQRLVLADVHAQREFYDLAEEQLRIVIEADPFREEVWPKLFETHLKIGDKTELIDDFLAFSEVLVQGKKISDALDILGDAIASDPSSIAAREKYIQTYLLAGEEEDLCEEYLALADLYIEANRVDEGVELFGKVMSLDPENRNARERLTETQARRRGEKVDSPRKPAPPPARRPHESWGSQPRPQPLEDFQEPAPEQAGTQSKRLDPQMVDPVSPQQEGDTPGDASDTALRQVGQSYRDILSVNPQNAEVCVKLADICQQLGETDEMVDQLRQASESLFQKGDLTTCINVCERILKVKPADQKVRLRLKQAFNKRDAFKALESAILFSDRVEDSPPGGPKRQK